MDTLHMYHELEQLLRMDSRYCTDDGVLLKNRIVEDALAVNPLLIKQLLSHEGLKHLFFTDVEGVQVFDKVKFQRFVSDTKFLGGSYTAFKNKIGLSDGKYNFISESQDIVLSWPYKDCMLEGGQTKEDAKRDEIFWNETLAPDEINRLTEPKVLSDFLRYDKDGVHKVEHLHADDNLIIKGNNLYALSSLLVGYTERIKSVFIDPPYYFMVNKPSDTFSYNSNFKLSTWLVFLQNRIRLTHKLLRNDGLLFIAMSDEGVHYLKVMIDQIFRSDNFIADVTWESRKSISSDGLMSMNSNHILVYAKDINMIHKNDFRLALDEESFIYDDEDGRGKYKLAPLDAPEVRANGSYEIINPNNGEKYLPPRGRHWSVLEQTYLMMLEDGRIRFGSNGTSRPQVKTYYSDALKAGKGKATSSIWHDVSNSIIWQDIDTNTNATKDQIELFGEVVFTNPKPEDLIRRIIELSTNEGDIVLDYFMGSGTTQAVAMKMNRKFIGIEQMDYINDVTIKRMQFVMKGEQTGISRVVNWQGGGSFVYCELAKANAKYADEIEAASSPDTLKEIWSRMKTTDYLNYKVDVKAIDTNAADFDSLGLEDQKRFLIECLDKNLLYVPLSDIDSNEYGVTEEDKRLTKEFYRKEK